MVCDSVVAYSIRIELMVVEKWSTCLTYLAAVDTYVTLYHVPELVQLEKSDNTVVSPLDSGDIAIVRS